MTMPRFKLTAVHSSSQLSNLTRDYASPVFAQQAAARMVRTEAIGCFTQFTIDTGPSEEWSGHRRWQATPSKFGNDPLKWREVTREKALTELAKELVAYQAEQFEPTPNEDGSLPGLQISGLDTVHWLSLFRIRVRDALSLPQQPLED